MMTAILYGADSQQERLERHSSTGLNASPKKGGRGGKYVWGSWEDDLADA